MIDLAPGMTPLLRLGGFAPHREGRKYAKSDQVLGKEQTGTEEIHHLDADLEPSESAADQDNILVSRSHVSLLS